MSLPYKIYRDGKMVGQALYAEDAANMAGFRGEGGIIKINGRIVWREGKEVLWAADSADGAAEIMHIRLAKHHEEHLTKMGYKRNEFGKIVPIEAGTK